jgi:hypothetical protein
MDQLISHWNSTISQRKLPIKPIFEVILKQMNRYGTQSK